LQDFARFSPRKIGYDPWNAGSVANNLVAEGLPIEQFRQGPQTYHPAMQAFEIAYTSQALVHGSHPVLKWNAANLVDRRDVNMNMAPDKKRCADKIDGIQCVIMAFGLAAADDATGFDDFLSNPVSA
jgi:phage terminase large subunit-like protein